MSLKQEIETWVAALAAYDNNEFDAALRCFETISDTSKILFNTGVIYATLGQHAAAVDSYQRAVQLDQYLAVAYFQQGVSNFLMGDFEEALANFNDTLLYLRGNKNIDYEQLGLKFKLYSCEVLFNRGLCYIYLQQKEVGMQDLMFAAKEKAVADHDVIDEAIREHAEGYTVFSIPVGVVYRPNEAKVRNLKARDFLGKAKLVAQQDQNPGVDPRRQAAKAALALDDRPGEKLSYAALNLVKPDLRSRSRQQSEPPLNRNVFPPTPPPEPERPQSYRSTDSIGSGASGVQHARPHAKPLRLELGAAAFEQHRPATERPRLGTRRAESERPVQRDPGSLSLRNRRSRENRYQVVPDVHIQEDPIEAYGAHPSTRSSHQRLRPSTLDTSSTAPILEEQELEDEDAGFGRAVSSNGALAFEIVPPPRHRSLQGAYGRPQVQDAPPPEMSKVRIKVHGQDMRYVMTTPSVTFPELENQVRKKFGLTGLFKLKIRDEDGDLVTLADQDDLDMAMSMSMTAAAKERAEMGKMEMWVQDMGP